MKWKAAMFHGKRSINSKVIQNSVELEGMLLKLFTQKYNIHNTRHATEDLYSGCGCCVSRYVSKFQNWPKKIKRRSSFVKNVRKNKISLYLWSNKNLVVFIKLKNITNSHFFFSDKFFPIINYLLLLIIIFSFCLKRIYVPNLQT